MKRRVRVLPRADFDVWTTADWLLRNVGDQASLKFRTAVDQTIELISEQPGVGRQYKYDVSIRGHVVSGYPKFRVLYREYPNAIEIIRVFPSSDEFARLFNDAA